MPNSSSFHKVEAKPLSSPRIVEPNLEKRRVNFLHSGLSFIGSLARACLNCLLRKPWRLFFSWAASVLSPDMPSRHLCSCCGTFSCRHSGRQHARRLHRLRACLRSRSGRTPADYRRRLCRQPRNALVPLFRNHCAGTAREIRLHRPISRSDARHRNCSDPLRQCCGSKLPWLISEFATSH